MAVTIRSAVTHRSRTTIGDPATPDVQHDFTSGALPSWITFSRTSNAWYFNSSGVLTQALANTARFDYDPVTLAARGLLLEDTISNYVRYSRDLSQSGAWTVSNITAARDQTGLDGVSSSASSILATADSGTILQTCTASSAARIQSAYIKRLVGSGAVYMTMDNGSTWVDISSQITSSWGRAVIPSQTLANPTVGFKIAVNGDKIAVDCVQNEGGAYASSPVITGSAAAARTFDSAYLTGAAATIAQAASGTAIMQVLKLGDASLTHGLLCSASARRLMYVPASNTQVTIYNGTNSSSATIGNSGAWLTGPVRAGVAWGASSWSISANNSNAVNGAYAIGSTASSVYIGFYGAANNNLCGWLTSMALYTNRVTDAQLKYKTSVSVPY